MCYINFIVNVKIKFIPKSESGFSLEKVDDKQNYFILRVSGFVLLCLSCSQPM